MINKIVYTYWTNKGIDYKLGFLNVENMLAVFKKSIEQSYKLVDKVEVYCDQEGYDFLLGKIRAVLIVVDYSKYDFDSRYWNFPKIITYNLQEEPFLHIDIDAIVYNFDRSAEVVSEMKRGVAYDRSLYPSHEDKKELLSHFNGWLTTSGLLGGNNLELFKQLFKEVEVTVKNKDKWVILTVTRMVIEEVVISALISKMKLNVSYLDKEEGDYIHYWGKEKEINFL